MPKINDTFLNLNLYWIKISKLIEKHLVGVEKENFPQIGPQKVINQTANAIPEKLRQFSFCFKS